jgi:transcriptional regulator with XRE-family HTH domain
MRYRAARAWANLSQIELAKELGLGVATVKRREGGEADPKRGELIALAEICDVPIEFLLDGFKAIGAPPSRSEARQRFEHLEATVRVLLGLAAGKPLTELQDQLTDQVTRDLLGLDDAQSEQSDQNNDDATDAT